MKAILLTVLLVLLTAAPVLAQEGGDGSAPVIVSIEPADAVAAPGETVIFEITYDDEDGDANRFEWTMVDTDLLVYALPAGRFNQAIAGETIAVPFGCGNTPSFARIQLEVVDAAGNRSQPKTLTLTCEDDARGEPPAAATEEPMPEGTAEPAPEDAGQGGGMASDNAPVIIGFDPPAGALTPNNRITVELTVEDPDLDARRLLWTLAASDLTTSTLPEGTIFQGDAQTTVPLVFFCTTPFRAALVLVVKDLNGNQSAPAVFELVCSR